MNNWTKILGILLICMMHAVSSRAQEAYTDTIRNRMGADSIYVKVVRDTVWMDKSEPILPSDVIVSKPYGRFDRSILNFRFIPKGKWIGGVTFSYINYDSDDSRLLFSLFEDFDCNLRTLSVKPFVGYAIKNNIIIGLKFGYNHTNGRLDNISLQYDDIDFSLKDMKYTEDSYSYAFFHRSYVGLDADRRFGLFNETSIGYNRGTSRFARIYNNELKSTEASMHEITLGINPGMSVFIMENVSAEVSFGVAGFKYRIEKQTNELGETGRLRNSGANFKINILNINIGVTACF